MRSDMHIVKYEMPEINPAILHSEIVDWKFQEKLFKDHGKYCIRYQLVFEDGRVESRQKGGFKTKKEAITERQSMITKLHNHEFASFPSITVKEFYDYWLYYHVMKEKKSSYDTFMSYKNVIYNYLVPLLGERRLTSIKRSDLVHFLSQIPYKSVLKMAEHIVRISFQYGKAKNFLEYNPALSAINDNRTRLKMEEKQNPEYAKKPPTANRRHTYNINQVCRLLAVCKEKKSMVYLPLLITLTTGLRISELIALKFSNIDTFDQKLYVEHQLGRKLEFMEDSKNIRNQELATKSENGVRTIALADFTLEEIMLENKRRRMNGSVNSPYIFCMEDGSPVHRNYFQKEYKAMVEAASLPYIRWHDHRHTYATILYNNDINLKAISQSLGHATEYFTKAVYIEEKNDLQIVTVLDKFNSLINDSVEQVRLNTENLFFNMNFPWEQYLEPNVEEKRTLSQEEKIKSILIVNERRKKEKNRRRNVYMKKMDCNQLYNFCYPFEKYLEQMEKTDIPIYNFSYSWERFLPTAGRSSSIINLVYSWEKILEKAEQYEKEQYKPTIKIYQMDYEWSNLWKANG